MRLLLLFSLLCPASQAQTDFWIDPVLGSDQAAGTSAGAPLKTITRGLELSGPGTTIFLAAGEYSAASGEAPTHLVGVGVTIESLEGPEVTTLRAQDPQVSLELDSGAVLEGVTIRAPDGSLFVLSTTLVTLAARAVVRNCQFLGGGTAIFNANVDVEGCRFEGQFTAGAVAFLASSSFTDCEFVGMGSAFGIFQNAFSTRLDVLRCTLYGYERAGIQVRADNPNACPSLSLKDSLVVNNPGSGLRVTYPIDPSPYKVNIEGTTFDRNGHYGIDHPLIPIPEGLTLRSTVVAGSGIADFRGSGTAEYSLIGDGSGPSGATNLTGAPGFVDAAAGDWSLRFDSPCLDRGDPASVGLDLLGHPRAVDSDLDLVPLPDMGAFEHRPLVGPKSATVGQPFELGVTGPAGGFSTIIVAPLGYAQSGATTPFGRLFLNPQGAFRIVPALTTGGGPTFVGLASALDPAWIGTSVGFQALPRSTNAPAGGAYSNPLLIQIQ